MNKWILGGIGLGVGLGAGIGIGWLIFGKKKKIEPEVVNEDKPSEEPEEITGAQIYASYFGEHTQEMNHLKDQLLEKFGNAQAVETEVGNLYSTRVNEIPYRKEQNRKSPYTINVNNGEEVDDTKTVDEVQLRQNNYQPEKDIEIITAEQFAKECRGFEKVDLLWWRKNNLMTTEDYDILNAPDILGVEWTDRIGEFEPNMVYVRNNVMHSDFAIEEQKEDYYAFRS